MTIDTNAPAAEHAAHRAIGAPAKAQNLEALAGSVRTYVQIRLSAGGGHGKRLIVETNLPRQGPDCHDHQREG
jgi:hypothetical protein